jgi:hypothetical protein
MTQPHDERQALHRENQRISGHLNGLASLRKRRTPNAETVHAAAAPTPTIPIPQKRPTARIATAPVQAPPPAPEPEAAHGFFDDFDAAAEPQLQNHDDGTFSLDDSTAVAPVRASATDTGPLSASAEETSDELRRPDAAAPPGEAINDILDGFNW